MSRSENDTWLVLLSQPARQEHKRYKQAGEKQILRGTEGLKFESSVNGVSLSWQTNVLEAVRVITYQCLQLDGLGGPSPFVRINSEERTKYRKSSFSALKSQWQIRE